MSSKTSLLNTVNLWFLRTFMGIWGLFVILDYLQRTPYFTKSLAFFAYWDVVIILLAFSILFVYLLAKKRRIGWTVVLEKLTGWKIYAILLFFMTVIFAAFGLKVNLFVDGAVKSIGHLLFFSVYIQAAVFFIVLLAYGLGNWLLDGLNLKLSRPSLALIEIVTGFSILVFILFFAGMLHVLNPWVTWIGVLAGMALLWRRILPFGKKMLIQEIHTVEIPIWQLIPVMILLIYVAMNLMAMIRPIPIGFDALNLYMNTPKLISNYQGLTQGGHAYNWSLLMSLGFILFNSTPITLTLSILPGVLSLFVLYRLARNFVDEGWSIVVVALFYTMPTVLWQSTSEAKVDLAALYVLLSAILLIIEYGSRTGKQIDSNQQNQEEHGPLARLRLFKDVDLLHWSLAGWLMGFAFGIKYTSLFAILSCICLIFYRYHSKWAFWASFFMCFALVFGLDLYQLSSATIDKNSISLLLILLTCLSVGLFVYSWLKDNRSLLLAGKLVLVFGLSAGLTFLPWAVKNIWEVGELSISALTNGKKAQKPLKFYQQKPAGQLSIPDNNPIAKTSILPRVSSEIAKKNGLSQKNKNVNKQTQSKTERKKQAAPPETTGRKKGQQRNRSGAYEEIDRYIGYEQGVIRYLSLFYDLTIKSNVNGFIVDVGFILFLFLPLCAFSRKDNHFAYNIGKAVIFSLVLVFSVWSVHRASDNADLSSGLTAAGKMNFTESTALNQLAQPLLSSMHRVLLYAGNALSGAYHYLTIQSTMGVYCIVIFSGLIFYLIYRQAVNALSQTMKWLLAFSITYFMLWLVFSSGIIWYGIAGLALAPLIIIAIVQAQNGAFASDKASRGMAIGFIAVWLFFSLVVRFTNISKADVSKSFAKQLYFNNFANYKAGIYTQEQCLNTMNPAYAPALNEINRNEEAGILRIGTYINYYISHNDKRVYMDNQLDIFNNLAKQLSSQQDITAALKSAGIRYIVFDFNTATYDDTPEKSLEAKVTTFYKYLYNNPHIELISTDRLVVDSSSNKYANINNQKIPVNNQVFGKEVVHWGIIAVYRIT
ncbi:MAG: hypothetical protein V3V18_02825 [Methylococcales bacterium]